MKQRCLYLLLVVVMISGLLSGCGKNHSTSSDAVYTDPELARAVELGIGQHRESDDIITYSEFSGMLDNVVERSCAGDTAQWESIFQKAQKSNRTMTRREGMVAVYFAAESLGENYYQYNNSAAGTQIFEEIASVDEWLF